MKNEIPQGPYHNPEVAEGIHIATVVDLLKGNYGKDKLPYIKAIFHLPGPDVYFVSNFYPKASNMALQRFSMFCACIGLGIGAFIEARSAFLGRHIRLAIRQMQNDCVNHGSPYYDVERFQPAIPTDVQQSAVQG